jgi:hypothetical protein
MPSIPDTAQTSASELKCFCEYHAATSRWKSGETEVTPLHLDAVRVHAFHIGNIIA